MKKAVRRNAHRERTSKRATQLRLPGSEKSRPSSKIERSPTSDITYEIVQHDGGWAYKVNGVFSEPFPTSRRPTQPTSDVKNTRAGA
jgi:hypothetical protein